MPTQNTREKFAPASVQSPAFQQHHAVHVDYYRQSTACHQQPKCRELPIDCLSNFEKIIDQFAAYGLQFEDAIAIRPSNPGFQHYGYQTVVAPTGQCKSLKIIIERTLPEIEFWLIGSKAVTVSTLDSQGQHLSVEKSVEDSGNNAFQGFPKQRVAINISAAAAIRVDSKAPFIMTHCKVNIAS